MRRGVFSREDATNKPEEFNDRFLVCCYIEIVKLDISYSDRFWTLDLRVFDADEGFVARIKRTYKKYRLRSFP